MSRLSTPAEPLAVEATKNSDLDPATEEKLKRDVEVMRSLTICGNCHIKLPPSSYCLPCVHVLCPDCFSLSLLQTKQIEGEDDQDVEGTTGKRVRPFSGSAPAAKIPKTGDGKAVIQGRCLLCSCEFFHSPSGRSPQEYTVPEPLMNQMRITTMVLNGEMSVKDMPSAEMICSSKAFCHECHFASEVKAVTRCDKCLEIYCVKHGKEHDELNRRWGHTCSRLINDVPSHASAQDESSMDAKCPLHPRLGLDRFCRTCDRFICKSCLSSDHRSHNVLRLSSYLLSILNNRLNYICKGIEDNRIYIMKSYDPIQTSKRVRESHQSQIDLEKKRIDDFITLLSAFIADPAKNKITAIVADAYSKAINMVDERLMEVNEMMKRFDEDLINLKRFIDIIVFFMESSSLGTFVSMYPVFNNTIYYDRWVPTYQSFYDFFDARDRASRCPKIDFKELLVEAFSNSCDPDPDISKGLHMLPALLRSISI